MRRNSLAISLGVVCLFCSAGLFAQQTSRQIPFNNVVTTLPANTTQNVTAQLWDAVKEGTLVFSEAHSKIEVDDGGQIGFLFGSRTPEGLSPDHFTSGSSRFLDVVDQETGRSVLAEGRIALTATAFALSPGPPGPEGPRGPEGPQGPPGPVRSVTAGTGLTGGGVGDVTLGIANRGVSTPQLALSAVTGANVNVPLELRGAAVGPILSGSNSGDGPGVAGAGSIGVDGFGTLVEGAGVRGRGRIGVRGEGPTGVFGLGISSGSRGIWGVSKGGGTGFAGYFGGNVQVIGTLSKGGGSFKIDHPLDPAGKYLYHSFVESPDMMNIYNGVIVLDANGDAVVTLPEWFETLNRDFRYQLTCIGGFAPVYIAEEVANNRFRIAGGVPGRKVSWQVTGIRQDAWANAHRIPVEEDKPAAERGYYLHPSLFAAPEEKGIDWAHHPDVMKRMKTEENTEPGARGSPAPERHPQR